MKMYKRTHKQAHAPTRQLLPSLTSHGLYWVLNRGPTKSGNCVTVTTVNPSALFKYMSKDESSETNLF